MGTRAAYLFDDGDSQHAVYKHWDGNPSDSAKFLAKAAGWAWDLPRFEADEFAAAFVAANKGAAGGNVRLLTANTRSWPSDLAFRYRVTVHGKELRVDAWESNRHVPGEEEWKSLGTDMSLAALTVCDGA